MTLLKAMTEVGKSLTNPIKVKLADLEQHNLGVEDTNDLTLIIAPFETVDNKKKARFNSTAVIISWLLIADEDDKTVDYDQEKLEEEIHGPMRGYARAFINKLLMHEIIDSETEGIETVTYTPVYGVLDDHLHGIMIEFTIFFNEEITSC